MDILSTLLSGVAVVAAAAQYTPPAAPDPLYVQNGEHISANMSERSVIVYCDDKGFYYNGFEPVRGQPRYVRHSIGKNWHWGIPPLGIVSQELNCGIPDPKKTQASTLK